MTVPAGEPTPEETALRYGVTVGDVRELVSHIYPNPIANDPHFGGDAMDPTITDPMISNWIDRVSDSVRARVAVLSQYSTHEERWAAIVGSARTAVLNGAAAYVVDAAYPMRAGTNEQSSYSGALWTRYRDEIAYISETLPKLFIAQDDTGPIDEEGRIGVTPLVTRQAPSFLPPGLFHYNPAYDPYSYPPAPGTEFPRS